MILNFDQNTGSFHATSHATETPHTAVLDTFCAVTNIIELVDFKVILCIYDPSGHERWYLRMLFIDGSTRAETLPVAEPILLLDSTKPEFFLKVWRSGRIESLRCKFERGDLEWDFCSPDSNNEYRVISETRPEGVLPPEVLESGVLIHYVSTNFSSTDAQSLMQQSIRATDDVSWDFLQRLSCDIQQYWKSSISWPVFELAHSSKIFDVEISTTDFVSNDCDLFLVHSYGVYGQRIAQATTRFEGANLLRIRELVIPQPRDCLTDYAGDLSCIFQHFAPNGRVVASTVSAGSVPVTLSIASDRNAYSGLIFDRCISATGSSYISELDNRHIFQALPFSSRRLLRKGFEVARSEIPILSFSSMYDSRIGNGDKLRFGSNLREDLVQLDISGGHANTPWDVDQLKRIIGIAFLKDYISLAEER